MNTNRKGERKYRLRSASCKRNNMVRYVYV